MEEKPQYISTYLPLCTSLKKTQIVKNMKIMAKIGAMIEMMPNIKCFLDSFSEDIANLPLIQHIYHTSNWCEIQ
jgi:hypothetical protein